MTAADARAASWTFLTNHGHVLLAIARDPDVRVEDIAAAVGITPRAVLAIVHDLEEAGYLVRERVGRRTHYTLRAHQHFRHPTTKGHEVDELLAIFAGDRPVQTMRSPTRRRPRGLGSASA